MATTPHRKSLTAAQAREGVGAELLSLLDGITADGRLSEDEVAELRTWLQENGDADLPAIKLLDAEVARILEDGVVTPQELETLHVMIESVLPVDLRRESREKRRLLAAEAKAAIKEANLQARVAAKEAKVAEQELRARSRRIDYANFMVAGVHIGQRQAVIRTQVAPGAPAYLTREPQNPYDRNAIIVQAQSGAVIGYVPRDDAAELAPLLDDGAKYTASVTKVLGYNKAIPVVQADLYRPDADERIVGRAIHACGRMGGRARETNPSTPSNRVWLILAAIAVGMFMLLCIAMCAARLA